MKTIFRDGEQITIEVKGVNRFGFAHCVELKNLGNGHLQPITAHSIPSDWLEAPTRGGCRTSGHLFTHRKVKNH